MRREDVVIIPLTDRLDATTVSIPYQTGGHCFVCGFQAPSLPVNGDERNGRQEDRHKDMDEPSRSPAIPCDTIHTWDRRCRAHNHDKPCSQSALPVRQQRERRRGGTNKGKFNLLIGCVMTQSWRRDNTNGPIPN